MNQNPEQPQQQNNYTQYPYDPTQAAPPPYDPTQLASPPYQGNQGYSSPSYPTPSTAGNSAPDYLQQSPYAPQSPYPTPNAQPNQGGYPAPGNFAPPPGAPQYPGYSPAPKKNRTWLWVTLGIVGVLLVALIASCAIFSNTISHIAQSTATTTSTASTPTTTTDATPTTTDSNNGGSTSVSGGDSGKTLTLQGVNCTMSQVRIIPGDDYAQPKAGNQFVQLHVKIVNNTNAKQHYNPLDFKVLTSDGRSLTHSYIVPTDYDNQLSFGDLAAGKSVEGNLIFELPTNDHHLVLSWDPTFNMFADNPGEAKWNLGL
ncbi:DUF4352 domain-containing protein [Dictyobacter aurantiacus]|uniref:DUF4352 domain-containing protein n=1 Tax=Dictyobacter aurantiacus TaxID=1936993 RepID=A0A401ZNV1_9CHLR|nr:DUF4352 domain-containing protein [Dictyobacter aurantiacus]GCE08588.1 hypothetical protein KDAU_59170 [Dictyobacter aurantiacus]